MPEPSVRPRSKAQRALAILVVGGIATSAFLWSAGFFDRDALRLFVPQGRRAPVAALLFSGDTGLRYGMGPSIARSLAHVGIEVAGVSSPSLFDLHRSRTELDAIVADAVRQGLARSKAARLVLIGQSFGADVLQTGLADLPVALRHRIAAVILVVPGKSVFFRADPTGIAYRGTPDSLAASTIDQIDWAPLTCIYGLAETDSACPAVHVEGAHVIGMPGGHFLSRDSQGLARQILAAIERAVPGAAQPDTAPS